MKFIVVREHILQPLQQVSSQVGSKRLTLPILSHLLLLVQKDCLIITGTDLEIEIIAKIALYNPHEFGAATVAARKFVDICRSLPEESNIIVQLKNDRILIISERSRFCLSTLPTDEFPTIEVEYLQNQFELTVPKINLKKLIESTKFAMANQDVRYYLNGMLFEIRENKLSTIATDGHRLAVCSILIDRDLNRDLTGKSHAVIVPRKGVIELTRMLVSVNNYVTLQMGRNNIRASGGNYILTSKLIDGSFPDYNRVLPKNPDNVLEACCDELKQAFTRAAILSNDKCRGVRLYLSNNKLKITANNQEQEEAEEILDVAYIGKEMEICFNVSYILDVLNVLKCKNVRLLLTDELSIVKIIDGASKAQTSAYFVMPMRL